jgi:hypothetical protein
MWEQMPVNVRLSVLFYFVAILTILIQGFRNLTVPIWVAIAALPTFGLAVHHQLWLIRSCYTARGMVGFWIDCGAVCLMCLHHIIQRPATRR